MEPLELTLEVDEVVLSRLGAVREVRTSEVPRPEPDCVDTDDPSPDEDRAWLEWDRLEQRFGLVANGFSFYTNEPIEPGTKIILRAIVGGET